MKDPRHRKADVLLRDGSTVNVRPVRVEDAAAVFLGHTQPLAPGELGVVRMGEGFAAGEHELTIAAEGCYTRPAATRRVTLAKLSPDHGWRAVAK